MFLREGWYVPVILARQYGTDAGLNRLRLRGLNAMLDHSRQRVPFYRGDPRYGTGRVASLAEWAELPLLTKQILRERGDEFVADGVDPASCHEFFTSGTTGVRLRVLHDSDAHDYHMASCVRRFTATRRYWPHYRLSHFRHFTPPRRTMERFGLFRRHVLLTEQPLGELVEPLLANRPRVVIGYPVHLRELLRVLTSEQLATLRAALRFVVTEAEVLYPWHREILERGFGVPVFDEYSAWETLNIHYGCWRGGNHIAEDRVHVEIVDEDGKPVPDGTEGQVLVTHFRERAMPLIRYALGDVAVVEPGRCRCGRRFRTMHVTRGRVNDRIVRPNGQAIYSDVFLDLAERFPGIAECFVRQDEEGLVTVHVVPDGTAPMPEVAGRLSARLRELAPDLTTRVLPADRVPISAGGKGMFVESAYRPETMAAG
jgi:phenylacetate-coenzyme A ligase PaaK-like adenylate-forming protein